MHHQDVFERYIELCKEDLESNSRMLSLLRRRGLTERFIFENFSLGYAAGRLVKAVGDSSDWTSELSKVGILKNNKEVLLNRLIIPVTDESATTPNITGYSLHPRSKRKLIALNEGGIFNEAYLKNADEIIFTEDPLEALFLIQNDWPNTTFLFGSDQKYVRFMQVIGIRRAVFTFEGRARLFLRTHKKRRLGQEGVV